MDRRTGSLETLAQKFPAQILGAGPERQPRYHLFHAANSVCSQKVRSVLYAMGEPFHSHNVNIFAGESYEPGYVAMRAQACLDKGFSFAALHSGSTSVAETGCDACVVPTLVDERTSEILIDSLQICLAISERDGGALRPPHLAAEIDREIAIVDSLPNYPLLASKVAKPNADGRGNTFSASKVERCDRLIADHADDPLLVAAYTAKRDKESNANTGLFTPAAISAAEENVKAAIVALEDRLPDTGRYLFGDSLTLADIFWAIELIRSDDLGYGSWIENLPKLARYYSALCATPSIRAAILDWPGARIALAGR